MTTKPQHIAEKLNWRKGLTLLLKLGLGVLAIYLISRKVEWHQVGQYLVQAQWGWLILAFLSFFFSKVIAALRINTFYRTQGIQLGESLNLRLSLLGSFYNLFVPLVGGEGYRIYWLRQHFDIPTKQLVWASLLERVNGLVALLALALLALPLTSFDFPYKPASLALIPLLYLAYYLGSSWVFPSFQAAWWRASALSLAVQSLQVLCTFFVLLTLGVETLQIDYLFVFLLSCLAYVLPFIGAREMAFVFGAHYLGLNPDLSLTISLLFYLALAMTSLIGLYFVFFSLPIPKHRTANSSQ